MPKATSEPRAKVEKFPWKRRRAKGRRRLWQGQKDQTHSRKIGRSRAQDRRTAESRESRKATELDSETTPAHRARSRGRAKSRREEKRRRLLRLRKNMRSRRRESRPIARTTPAPPLGERSRWRPVGARRFASKISVEERAGRRLRPSKRRAGCW